MSIFKNSQKRPRGRGFGHLCRARRELNPVLLVEDENDLDAVGVDEDVEE